MYKLLIADDEPIARTGIVSMLDWASIGVEVIGAARNGQHAMEMIESQLPDIIITDIKMPVKDGLALALECNEKYAIPPAFIILTSYDDFEFARSALKARAVDYLIKTEIDAKTLAAAVECAAARHRAENRGGLRETFFVKLFNNQIEGDEDLDSMKRSACIRDAPFYLAADCALTPADMTAAQFAEGATVVEAALLRLLDGYTISPGALHFSVVFLLASSEGYKTSVSRAFASAFDALKCCPGLALSVSVGCLVSDLRGLGLSYSLSRSGHGEPGSLTFNDNRSMRESHKERIVGDIKKYVKENLGRKLTLDEVAEKFNFNASYTSRLFSECAGESFVDYLTSQRVEEARKLLAAGTLSIAEIAEAVGFESPFYFSRVFKRVTGVSPSKFSGD